MIEQTIDIDSWKHREIFNYYSMLEHPFYRVTFTIDVTNLYRYVKKHQISFYYSMIYAIVKAVNRTEQFRYGIEDGGVVLYDHRIVSFTDLRSGEDQFRIITLDVEGDMKAFAWRAKEIAEAQDCFINLESQRRDRIFITCVPWVELTSLSSEGDFHKDDTVPRVSWGKFMTEADGHRKLNITLEVNHRLIDGYHIGQFHTALQSLIASLY